MVAFAFVGGHGYPRCAYRKAFPNHGFRRRVAVVVFQYETVWDSVFEITTEVSLSGCMKRKKEKCARNRCFFHKVLCFYVLVGNFTIFYSLLQAFCYILFCFPAICQSRCRSCARERNIATEWSKTFGRLRAYRFAT